MQTAYHSRQKKQTRHQTIDMVQSWGRGWDKEKLCNFTTEIRNLKKEVSVDSSVRFSGLTFCEVLGGRTQGSGKTQKDCKT